MLTRLLNSRARTHTQWEIVNSEYQRFTFNVNYLDSLSKVRRKEESEEKLKYLEKSIAQLSSKHVFLQNP